MTAFIRLIGDIRQKTSEIEPNEAWRRMQEEGALLVDVREEYEWAMGKPLDSVGLPRSHVEFQIERVAPDPQREVLLICAAGMRSLLVADALRRMGYKRVASIAGGFTRWRADGLPVVENDLLDADARERYDRHLKLPQIGIEGQKRLLNSRVLIVGAGGLGSPAAFYLAAAGVGTLSLVDDDQVERSNLQRQILHTDAMIGQGKTQSAVQRLMALNPTIDIHAIPARLTESNAGALFESHDLIIDGADNFPTRYLINATCLELGIPWVYGAVQGFTGQASLFVPGEGPCYRCLFPEPPPAAFAPNCAEAGVLGVLPGVIGLIQATEAVKHLLGLGESLSGRLLSYDALTMRFIDIRLPRDSDCPGCGDTQPV